MPNKGGRKPRKITRKDYNQYTKQYDKVASYVKSKGFQPSESKMTFVEYKTQITAYRNTVKQEGGRMTSIEKYSRQLANENVYRYGIRFAARIRENDRAALRNVSTIEIRQKGLDVQGSTLRDKIAADYEEMKKNGIMKTGVKITYGGAYGSSFGKEARKIISERYFGGSK